MSLQADLSVAARNGTRWLIAAAETYSNHERVCALMHLDFCRIHFGPSHRYVHEIVRAVSDPRILDPLRRYFAKYSRYPDANRVHALSYILYLGSDLGLLELPSLGRGMLQKQVPSIQSSIARVKDLGTATDYYAIAHGFYRSGFRLDVSRLDALSVGLPPMSKCRDLGTRYVVDCFNYCSHFVLHRTAYLRDPAPQLAASRQVEWLHDFWMKTPMRNDVEYLAEFINCSIATGTWPSCKEDEEGIRLLAAQQSQNGLWRGLNRYRRYDTFHATWRATEALVLSIATRCGATF